MNNDREEFSARIARNLDARTEDIDEVVLARLAAARNIAVGRARDEGRAATTFIPAMTFVATAAVLMVLLNIPSGQPMRFNGEQFITEMELVDAELEMIEELEFYRWLDANGYAG